MMGRDNRISVCNPEFDGKKPNTECTGPVLPRCDAGEERCTLSSCQTLALPNE